jgi:hypothetical protein
MENPRPNNDDELRAENALIRLKLEQEFGMQHASEPMEDPKAENQWLRHIYNIEQQMKNQKTIAVYDLIGRPDFKKPEELKPDEVESELNRLMSLLNNKEIELNTICDYEPFEIYRFIVEDLFHYQTDDMPYPGTTTCFIYEEFYPNHEHDIANDCGDTISDLLFGEWSDYWFNLIIADEVLFQNQKYPKSEIEKILKVFAEAHTHIEIAEIQNVQIQFDLETLVGSYSAQLLGINTKTKTDCVATIRFGLEFEISMWVVNSIELPDFVGQ